MDELLLLMMGHRERCLQNEPGTLQFEVLRLHDDQGKLVFYEVYTDEAAFKAHWEGPFVACARAETKDMILTLKGTRCSVHE
jgi:(4S)-4-hydroxy-5-phosphonooxypentane-2,3-dione isomerase